MAKHHKRAHKEEAKEVREPKYKLGDKVTVDGENGEITEIGQHDPHWLETHQQLYSIRLDPWKAEQQPDGSGGMRIRYVSPSGAVRDHAADVLGGVPEDEIQMRSVDAERQ